MRDKRLPGEDWVIWSALCSIALFFVGGLAVSPTILLIASALFLPISLVYIAGVLGLIDSVIWELWDSLRANTQLHCSGD